MFYLIYFLLTVVALTAVWAKGGDLLWVFASWQVRAILYQHILIKKSIENIHAAFRVSLGWTVAPEVPCVVARVAAVKAKWHTHWFIVILTEKIQLTFSWFKHKIKHVLKHCHLILMDHSGSNKGLSVSHASPDWVSSPLNHTLRVCADFTVWFGWGNVLWPQSTRSATFTECFRTS